MILEHVSSTPVSRREAFYPGERVAGDVRSPVVTSPFPYPSRHGPVRLCTCGVHYTSLATPACDLIYEVVTAIAFHPPSGDLDSHVSSNRRYARAPV